MIKPLKPQEPLRYQIYDSEKFEEKILASKYYIIAEGNDEYENIISDILDQEDCIMIDNCYLNNSAKMFSLQDFLDLSKDLGQDIDPNNLRIDMSHDRYFTYIKLSIIYTTYFSDSELKAKETALESKYNSDMDSYNKKMIKYTELLTKYNEAIESNKHIENEIKECEEKLNMLKSKLK